MKTRILTGAIFTLAMAAILIPGNAYPQIPLFAFFAVSVICLIEISAVFKAKLPAISQARCVIGSIGVFIPMIYVLFRGDPGWRLIQEFIEISPNRLETERAVIWQYLIETIAVFFSFWLILCFSVLFYAIISKGPEYFLDAIMEPVIITYVIVPMVCGMILLFVLPNGYLWFLAALIVSWVSDVFAYFTGVTMGKHKIIPQISPKKTWEGTLGGVFGSVFIMIIWTVFIMDRPDIVDKSLVYRISFGVVAGLILSIGSQFGDWLASSVKRWAAVKDFGNILPGHGGLTDRFDGVFFTFPILTFAGLIYYLV